VDANVRQREQEHGAHETQNENGDGIVRYPARCHVATSFCG